MKTLAFTTIKTNITQRYLLLISGLIYVAVGIWMLQSPVSSFLVIAFLASICFLGNGISEVIVSVTNRKKVKIWGWTLASGLLTTIIGLVLLASPLLSIAALPIYVGLAALFRSVIAISYSIELSYYGINQWGWLALMGIVGLVFSGILIWNPLFAGLSVVIWTSLSLLILGLGAVYFFFQLDKRRVTPI